MGVDAVRLAAESHGDDWGAAERESETTLKPVSRFLLVVAALLTLELPVSHYARRLCF
jgi:hypothetical protein